MTKAFDTLQPNSSRNWISRLPLPTWIYSHFEKWPLYLFIFFFAKIHQTKTVNGLIFSWALQLCCLLSLRAGEQGNLSALQRALQTSLLCSVKLRRGKDGPLTTDSCQLDDTLTLGRPMSSNGGDKCLANQLAYKITALPSTAHASTRSDSKYSLQLSRSVCVCVCVWPQRRGGEVMRLGLQKAGKAEVLRVDNDWAPSLSLSTLWLSLSQWSWGRAGRWVRQQPLPQQNYF